MVHEALPSTFPVTVGMLIPREGAFLERGTWIDS